jgi:hypothetical protein
MLLALLANESTELFSGALRVLLLLFEARRFQMKFQLNKFLTVLMKVPCFCSLSNTHPTRMSACTLCTRTLHTRPLSAQSHHHHPTP